MARVLAKGMRYAGCALDWVDDGRAGELALRSATYDAALLDLALPRKTGMELLRDLRHTGTRLPVLVITGRAEPAARVAALDGGADDYLVKPLDLDELLARVRAVVRRWHGRSRSLIEHGALSLDLVRRELRLRGAPVALTPREFAVMEALLREPGAVVPPQRLEDAIYAWGREVCSNSVQVHIHHLRAKLGADFIRSVRGVGYRVAKLS